MAAPLLASALVAFALVHGAGEAQATTLIPPTDFVPRGLGDGSVFRILFVTSDTTNLVPTKSSFTFFNTFVQNAVRDNAPASLKPYADQFRAVVSCGGTGAYWNTETLRDRGNWYIPIYWLKGAKVADDYRDFWSPWDSNRPHNERGKTIGSTLVWTGSLSNGDPAGIPIGVPYEGGGTTACSNLVTVGNPTIHGKEKSYYTMSSTSTAALYGLSPVFRVSIAPAPPAAPTVVSTTHNTASITWEAPAFHGATPIFDYNVQVKRAGGSWVGSTPYHWGTHTNLTLTGLSTNTEYQVRVHAKNHGTGGSETVYGPNSPVTTFRTQDLLPSTPGKPVVHPRTTTAQVSWAPSAWVGSPPLHDYDMTIRPATPGVNVGVHGTGTVFNITGLNPNTTYNVQVRANNTVGHSPWSQSTSFHTPTSDPSRTVSVDWSLLPGGLRSGDSFRLLFVTSDSRIIISPDFSVLDGFVQQHARNGHNDIRSFGGDFRAVMSSTSQSAVSHTSTQYSAGGGGVPIYWLNGAKVADDYRDFWDGCWDSNQPRDQNGSVRQGTVAWTGTNSDGSTADNPAGRKNITIGKASVQCQEIDGGSSVNYSAHNFYGLSPLLTVR